MEYYPLDGPAPSLPNDEPDPRRMALGHRFNVHFSIRDRDYRFVCSCGAKGYSHTHERAATEEGYRHVKAAPQAPDVEDGGHGA